MEQPNTRTLTCIGCNASFEGTPRAKRCEPCRIGHKRNKQRETMRAWRAAQTKVKTVEVACGDCGTTLTHGTGRGYSGKRLCNECVTAAQRANTKRHKRKVRAAAKATRPPRTCLDCPADLTQEHGKILRCRPCAEKHRKAWWLKNVEAYRHARRALAYSVGYERFSNKEIYERDGWRCGICRKAISRKLRHPNPMSVSLDHKISLSRGGSHSRRNTQPAHLGCNIRKNKYDALPGEQMPLPIEF